jgi:glycosyltransferase involved in cell wall biosynthesis
MKYKVSVCCLAYNHEKYIRQALESMVSQKTNFNYEIIVLDDASKDHTPDIIREFQEKYPDKIRPVLQTENQYSRGVAIVNEIFYPLAQGEYIAYCEGDDYWTDENKLQEQVDFLDHHKEYVACSHECWEVDEQGKKITEYYFNGCYKKHYDRKLHFNWQILSGQTATLMHRKEAYELPSEEALHELGKLKITGDVKKTAILVMHGPMYHTGKVMSHHRRVYAGNDSWSATTAKDNLRVFYFDALDDLAAYLNKYYTGTFSYEGFKIKMTVTSLYLYILHRRKDEWDTFVYMYKEIKKYPFAQIRLVKMFVELPFTRLKIKLSRQKNSHMNAKRLNKYGYRTK